MDRALEQYEAILHDNPRSLWARMRLGHLASRRRRHAEAADHYRAAARIVPAFRLAHSLWRDAHRRSEARVTPSLRESGRATRSADAY
jgi:tetratricopeptide (TPR) repeat protein